VTNIDWPSTGAQGNVEKQKQELTDILDALQAGNINAVCLQVRSLCDALYESSYEPWAVCLTGTRGKDPGYDPLQFAIEECHKRGMELHVWINPYRVTSEKSTTGKPPYQALPETDMLYTHGESHLSGKVIEYKIEEKYGQVLDPGYPEVRAHIVKVLQEIVTKYDIDGMLMDDYFYPSVDDNTKSTFDSGSQKLHFNPNNIEDFNENGSKLDDWRRSNVDQMVRDVYQMIQTEKPWVRFGMGPFGIWSFGENTATEKYGLVHPQGIRGANYYTERGCNTVEWIKQGWVDYVCPQLYWPTNQTDQDYNVLYEWWSGVCEKFSTDNRKVHFYPSPNAGRVYGADKHKWGIAEMKLQLNQGREKLTNGYSGAVFYSVRYYLNLNYNGAPICGNGVTTTMCEDLKASHFQQKALVPPMTWKSTGSLEAPTELSISGNTLTWKPEEGRRYTIYVYPKEVEMHTAIEQVDYLQRVVYGNSFTLPAGFNTATHNVAVRSYDRYGVEHAATEYTPDVTYVLNGGVLGNRTVVSIPNVPTQDELIAAFKTGYNSYFGANVATTRAIDNFLYVGTTAEQGGNKCDISKMMTDVNSGWKWLGDYIIAKAGAPDGTIEYWWRRNVVGFFNKGIYTLALVNSFDFSTAGQPSAWGPAYQAAHATTATFPLTLPEKIEGSAFTLPIAGEITHPNGSTFLGWYKNPDMTGDPILALTVGYKGTVYAKWSGITWMLYGGQYTGGTLPSTVQVPYTLPTKTQMQRTGYVFGGWYEKADFSGDVLTSIPANYTGVLHAKWIPANHITWHPYHCGEMKNEDLWEQFMEDYNDWYMNHSDQKILEARAEQPITNAFGFMFNGETVDGTKEGAKKYPNGLAKDFMTNPNSPWKWLGDYIAEIVEKENEQLESNDPLWTAFKEATGLTELGALKDVDILIIAGNNGFPYDNNEFTINTLNTLFNNEEWGWLKTYIMTEQNTQAALNKEFTGADGVKRKITTLDPEITENNCRNWVFAIAAFFTQLQYIGYPAASADFSEKGKHSVWKNTYHGENAHYQITKELDWRKMVHTFFNAGNTIQYVNIKGESVTEGTADFRTKGLPKPNGDPAAGWYNAWWNATFTDYLITGDPMPKVRCSGYAFAGWYYGIEEGYDCNKRVGVGGYDASQEHNNHLWARWLELCLYEGYVDKDIHSIAEKTKVNHNQELLSCINSDVTKKTYKLDIHRKFLSDDVSYSTLVLPFAIPRTSSQSAGDYLKQVTDENGDFVFDPAKGGEMPSILVCQGAQKKTVNGEDMVELVFKELDVTSKTASGTEAAVGPYVPFLIKPAEPLTARLHFWSAHVSHRVNPYSPAVLSGMQLQPVLSPTVITATSDCPLILVNNNRLAQVYSSGEMLGLRGYFILQPELRNLPVKITMRDNTPSNTENISTDAMIVEIKKILRNGQVYIIRNGQMYDLMGSRVE
jgi:uncharacterized repeat protein (TIGR02543 family)